METVTVAQIAEALESWAPRGTAESYDNVGLQVGRRDAGVRIGLVALDVTPAILDEAINVGATVIVTHHPLLFHPVKRLTGDDPIASIALRAAEAGVAIYSAHTNLDVARDGVSFGLAGQLGLINVDFLSGIEESIYKLVTFVPEEYADDVHAALARAGGGHIGAYRDCCFRSTGTGYFRPTEHTNPTIETPVGQLQSVDEVRLEIEVPRWYLSDVKAALLSAHPYEEVAFDVYRVEQSFRDAGLGATGILPEPVNLKDFLQNIASALNTPALRYAGNLDSMIRKVAVCGGSGSALISRAQAAGADAFVTADLSYHRYFEVLDSDGQPGMALVDAGHYETERITEQLVRAFLEAHFPAVDWRQTSLCSSPVSTFIP